MPNTKFDSKSFNPEAFGTYVKRIPNVKKTELAKCRAVGANEAARMSLSNQTGSLYARIPYFGRIDGSTSQNNDGNTNITTSNTTTYEQGFVTASRMDSWTERSFSKNITAGVDFMDNVAGQIGDYNNVRNILIDGAKGAITEAAKREVTRWLKEKGLPTARDIVGAYAAQIKEQSKDESGWCWFRDCVFLPGIFTFGIWAADPLLDRIISAQSEGENP